MSVPEKTLHAVEQLRSEQDRINADQQGQLDNIYESLTKINDKLTLVDTQVASMQHEKLMWAYVHYGLQKNPISLETRTSLCDMYQQYTAMGRHNHIPSDWEKQIMNAPVDGIIPAGC